MKPVLPLAAGAAALVAACALAPAAAAQSAPGPRLNYGDPGAGDDAPAVSDGNTYGPARGGGDGRSTYSPPGGAQKKARRRTKITPYLEIDQSVYDQVQPQAPAVTYTTLAAGADISINSHRTTGNATIRYEHHFSETHSSRSSDTITGLARTTTELVPRTVTFDFGGLATQTSINSGGSTLVNPIDRYGSIYRIWSLYGGPSLSTHAGILGIKAAYLAGYNEVDQIHSYVPPGGTQPIDLFGHSVVQQAQGSVGVRPHEILPFGVMLNGAWMREDTSNLDQRLIDEHIGVQITQPITRDAAIVGNVGWERVQVAHRDAVRDSTGAPVVGANGQYVINRGAPRKIAYDNDGLTWDVGVVWRPSKRTYASASVGQRYDSTTYYGQFIHAPNSRSTISVSVFDGIYGFGSSLTTTLTQVPTDFAAVRDPFSGNVGGCVQGATGGTCLSGVLGSANSLAFRAHGINAAYGLTVGKLGFNIGGGWFSRRFIGAEGTILASQNNALDQTYYASGGVSGPIDRKTRFYVNGFASLYRTSSSVYGDTANWGANGSLVRQLSDRLVGSASVEILGVNPQIAPDEVEMLGQVGLRYNFR